MLKRRAVTTHGAAIMYPGTSPFHFASMCLKGKRLRKLYGERVPPQRGCDSIIRCKGRQTVVDTS